MLKKSFFANITFVIFCLELYYIAADMFVIRMHMIDCIHCIDSSPDNSITAIKKRMRARFVTESVLYVDHKEEAAIIWLR